MSICKSCDLSASSAILIKTYCKEDRGKCSLIAKEFQKGDMTLRELAKKVNTDSFSTRFLDNEADLDITLKEAVKEDRESESLLRSS